MLRPSKPFCLLYLSFSLACIGDRMWNFAIVLILGRLGGMRLVAINQFTKGLTGILLSSWVGHWIDHHNRKVSALLTLAISNASIAALATFLIVCTSVNLEHMHVFDTENIIYCIFMFFSLLVSAVSRCASGGQKIVYTKDWVVVMAQRLDSDSLSSHNSIMFAISQTTAVIAPLATGFIFVSMGQRLACAILGAWNLISWIMEHCLLSNIYRLVPELANRRNTCIALNNIDPKEIERLLNEKEREIFQPTCFWKKVWNIYSRQQVFHVSIGYSLLYMTVLGLGGVSISYVFISLLFMSQHLPEDVLGFIRSTGSVLGLCGIASYKLLERRFHARKMAIIGLILQNMCLWACVVSIFLPGSPLDLNGYLSSINFENWMSQSKLKSAVNNSTSQTSMLNMTSFLAKKTVNQINWSDWTVNGNPAMSIFVFFGGVTAARLGLVMVDLSTLQIMQESILEDERGTVFGVQSALCQLFSVMRDVLCIILPDPRSFGILIGLSMVFLCSGLLNYSFYMFRTRKEHNQVPKPRAKTLSTEEIQ